MDINLTNKFIQASIVIPTYNRSDSLQKTLEALTRQNFNSSHFEVIVVSDGSTDGTREVVSQFSGKLQIQLIEQSNSGPAAARNHGVEQARGQLLIFLDDDAEAQPQFLAEHVRAHQQKPGLVLIGYLPPILEKQDGYFRTELLGWWETMFQKMRQPGYRFGYSDLLSGNFSIEAGLFKQAGGFNPEFKCHEDYELGIRLQELKADFAFSDQAVAFHHENTDLIRSLNRKYAEGIADVRIGQIYPLVRPTLLMARLQQYSLLPSRILQFLAFTTPIVGNSFASFLQKALSVLEHFKAYRLWQRLLYGLLGYWYWRGVANELKNLGHLKSFLAPQLQSGEPPESALDLDLALGVTGAENLLDLKRPDSVRLFLNHHFIGCIPPYPGGEKLRGAHLRPRLAVDFMVPMAKAMNLEGSFELLPDDRERFIARCDEAIKKINPVQNCSE